MRLCLNNTQICIQFKPLLFSALTLGSEYFKWVLVFVLVFCRLCRSYTSEGSHTLDLRSQEIHSKEQYFGHNLIVTNKIPVNFIALSINAFPEGKGYCICGNNISKIKDIDVSNQSMNAGLESVHYMHSINYSLYR